MPELNVYYPKSSKTPPYTYVDALGVVSIPRAELRARSNPRVQSGSGYEYWVSEIYSGFAFDAGVEGGTDIRWWHPSRADNTVLESDLYPHATFCGWERPVACGGKTQNVRGTVTVSATALPKKVGTKSVVGNYVAAFCFTNKKSGSAVTITGDTFGILGEIELPPGGGVLSNPRSSFDAIEASDTVVFAASNTSVKWNWCTSSWRYEP